MPSLLPGTKVIRLIPSTTGRQISPGMLGVAGGIDPSKHDNSNWPSWSFERVPIQWQNGLWSSMDPLEEGESWNFWSPTMPSSFTTNPPQNDPDNAQDYQGGIA